MEFENFINNAEKMFSECFSKIDKSLKEINISEAEKENIRQNLSDISKIKNGEIEKIEKALNNYKF